MKNIIMIAAAGSLTALAAPAAQAADIAPTASAQTSNIAMQAAGTSETANLDKKRKNKKRKTNNGRRDSAYDSNGRYKNPRRLSRNDRVWRGKNGTYYCQRDNGTTGLIVGAGVGALAGRTIDTNGDRSAGTILGAIAGGLLGREIDRGEVRCR